MAHDAYLLSKSENMKLPYGSIKEAVERFKVSPKTVEGVWKRLMEAEDEVEAIDAMRSLKKGRAGRRRIEAREFKLLRSLSARTTGKHSVMHQKPQELL